MSSCSILLRLLLLLLGLLGQRTASDLGDADRLAAMRCAPCHEIGRIGSTIELQATGRVRQLGWPVALVVAPNNISKPRAILRDVELPRRPSPAVPCVAPAKASLTIRLDPQMDVECTAKSWFREEQEPFDHHCYHTSVQRNPGPPRPYHVEAADHQLGGHATCRGQNSDHRLKTILEPLEIDPLRRLPIVPPIVPGHPLRHEKQIAEHWSQRRAQLGHELRCDCAFAASAGARDADQNDASTTHGTVGARPFAFHVQVDDLKDTPYQGHERGSRRAMPDR
mmetsp:Transcript_38443/g.105900  ORF Transcript_38443/g.105900 Transcript_38443/m.105900 type:complete len:281 (+) Transcript_38443:124-966(+)